jgi:uncharacterized protein YkwD
MSFIRKNLIRIIIYSLLFVVCTGGFFAYQRFKQKIDLLNSNLSKEDQLNSAIVSRQQLEKKKRDYQSQGIDISTLEEEFKRIYATIYIDRNSEAALNLISSTDKQLDVLMADFQNKKIAAELKKGVLLGSVTCAAAKCPAAVSIKLLNGKDTVGEVQTDAAGNYSFHHDAGMYSLSAGASGFQTVYKSGVDIVSQKQTAVVLDLPKVEPVKKSGGSKSNSSGSTSGAPSGSIGSVYNEINNHRQANGLSALSFNSALSNVAAKHAAWMASTGNFSHSGEAGSMPWDRCAAAGTSCSSETIYFGSSDPSAAVNSWKNSPPHNAIMLGRYSTIGIGVSGIYWSAVFR